MSPEEMRDFETTRANIQMTNDRILSDLARERWWHLYARAACGAVGTIVLLYVLNRLFGA